MVDRIFIGGAGPDYADPQCLQLKFANRHGLIAGATGTGKTVTLQNLAQGFSDAGVPVFATDIKGDLAGLAMPGTTGQKLHEAFTARAKTIGLDLTYASAPVVFWDIFGQSGHPVRTTVAEMGPLFIARLLDASEAQEGVINIAFRIADEQGLALLDLSDLRNMLVFLGRNAQEISLQYGSISRSSIGAIQRKLLILENQGGARMFGEPALDLHDMIRCNLQGQGFVNILAADQLLQSPRLYATFLLWLMSELFEELPEVGNPDKPIMVLMFDEAHLLFDGAPKVLVDKIEQVARLIRSKGVGVYFITQNPDDVPAEILSQIGNRIQHALRAFTARDQKQLHRASQTYRPNPAFDTAEAIRDVGTGEAVTSLMQDKGVPGVAQRTLIRPPASRLGPITPDERAELLENSPVFGKYEQQIDRISASEILAKRAEQAARQAEHDGRIETAGRGRRYGGGAKPAARSRPGFGKAVANMIQDELTGTTGRKIVRGILGGLFKGR